jgi:hypothetical protein
MNDRIGVYSGGWSSTSARGGQFKSAQTGQFGRPVHPGVYLIKIMALNGNSWSGRVVIVE